MWNGIGGGGGRGGGRAEICGSGEWGQPAATDREACGRSSGVEVDAMRSRRSWGPTAMSLLSSSAVLRDLARARKRNTNPRTTTIAMNPTEQAIAAIVPEAIRDAEEDIDCVGAGDDREGAKGVEAVEGVDVDDNEKLPPVL